MCTTLELVEVPQVLKGQKVTVALYGGTTAERRVVAEKGRTIVVCSEDEYTRAEREGREPEGIGFPKEDIVANGQKMKDGQEKNSHRGH